MSAFDALAAECERALAELDAELGARRRQVVRDLVARAAAVAESGGATLRGELGAVRPSTKPVVIGISSPPASVRDDIDSGRDRTASLSTLRHSSTRVLCASASGSPHLVETVLDDRRAFLTREPPCMDSPHDAEATLRPHVPPLDMTKVVLGSPSMAPASCEGAAHEAADGPLCALPEVTTPDDSQEGCTRASSAASRAWRKVVGPANRSAQHIVEVTMAILVLANAAALGWESSYTARGLEVPPGLLAAEIAFLVAYAAELAARSTIRSAASTAHHWRVFDIFVLTYGIFYVVLATSLERRPGAQGALRLAQALRWLRLLRLWRAAERCSAPRVLRRAAAAALAPVLWLLAAAVVGLYAYAALGMELIRPCPECGEEYEAVAELHFRTLGDSILALLSIITLDGVLSICVPLIAARPPLALYFGLLIAGGSVGVVGLITAIAAETLARASAMHSGGVCDVEDSWRPEPEAKKGIVVATPDGPVAPGPSDCHGSLGHTGNIDRFRHPGPGAQCRGDQEATFSWSPSTVGDY